MILKKLLLLSLCLLPLGACYSQTISFESFTKKFVSGYKELHINDLSLAYADNLKSIRSVDEVKRQTVFFTIIQQDEKNYNPKQLTPLQQLDLELITYEARMNLERLALEKQWLAAPDHSIT